MIPGANVYSHELNDNFKVSNDTIFNPYHTSHLTNQIGDLIENENGNDIWNEISDFLVSCQYKKPKNSLVGAPKKDELDGFFTKHQVSVKTGQLHA